MVNLCVRVLGNGAVFVQYSEDGKAKDAAFMSWPDFIAWLANKCKPHGNEIYSV